MSEDNIIYLDTTNTPTYDTEETIPVVVHSVLTCARQETRRGMDKAHLERDEITFRMFRHIHDHLDFILQNFKEGK